MRAFDPNQFGIVELFTNPVGPVGRALTEAGNKVVAVSKEYVSEQWPGGPGGPRPRPFRRSGTLQNSVQATEPLVIGGELQVQIWADPVNERGSPYGVALADDGYKFIDLEKMRL